MLSVADARLQTLTFLLAARQLSPNLGLHYAKVAKLADQVGQMQLAAKAAKAAHSVRPYPTLFMTLT